MATFRASQVSPDDIASICARVHAVLKAVRNCRQFSPTPSSILVIRALPRSPFFYICFCRRPVSYLFLSSFFPPFNFLSPSFSFSFSFSLALPSLRSSTPADSAEGNYTGIKQRFHERMLIKIVIGKEFRSAEHSF